MATWVMSDLHGNYRKYRETMDANCLQEMDTLYILGDVVDCGTGSCEILFDMRNLSHTPRSRSMGRRSCSSMPDWAISTKTGCSAIISCMN